MPLPVIPGVLRVAVTGPIAGGGSWVNVWHLGHLDDSGWDVGEITGVHAVFRQMYDGPSIGAGLELQQFIALGTRADHADYTPLDGSSGAFALPMTMSSNAPNSLPAEVAEVLTIRTALRGRQNRGRIFLPAFAAEFLTTAGRLAPVAVQGLVDQAIAVQAALVTGGAHIGVASYGPYKNPVTGVTSSDPAINGGSSPHFTPAAAFTMDDMADVIRGRKT